MLISYVLCVTGAMSDKLLETLLSLSSSSENHSRSRSRSNAHKFRRYRRPHPEGGGTADARAVPTASRSRSRSRPCRLIGGGRTTESGAVPTASHSRSRSRSSSLRARERAASEAAQKAVAEAGAGSYSDPAPAYVGSTGDELLDMLETFDVDSEDTDIERNESARELRHAELVKWSRELAKQQEAITAAETAKARSETKQLETLEIEWKRCMTESQDLLIVWPEFASAALIPGDSIEAAKLVIASRATYGGAFYIGGTMNPRRRWLGSTMNPGMPAHCDTYDHMVILAIANGQFAGKIEAALIDYSMNLFGENCLNTARDSRGLSRDSINFIYMCQM